MPISFFFPPLKKKFVVFLGDGISGKSDSVKQDGGFSLPTRRTERGGDILPSCTLKVHYDRIEEKKTIRTPRGDESVAGYKQDSQ